MVLLTIFIVVTQRWLTSVNDAAPKVWELPSVSVNVKFKTADYGGGKMARSGG